MIPRVFFSKACRSEIHNRATLTLHEYSYETVSFFTFFFKKERKQILFFTITGAIRKMKVSLFSLFDFSLVRPFFLTKEKLFYMSCFLLGVFFCV